MITSNESPGALPDESEDKSLSTLPSSSESERKYEAEDEGRTSAAIRSSVSGSKCGKKEKKSPISDRTCQSDESPIQRNISSRSKGGEASLAQVGHVDSVRTSSKRRKGVVDEEREATKLASHRKKRRVGKREDVHATDGTQANTEEGEATQGSFAKEANDAPLSTDPTLRIKETPKGSYGTIASTSHSHEGPPERIGLNSSERAELISSPPPSVTTTATAMLQSAMLATTGGVTPHQQHQQGPDLASLLVLHQQQQNFARLHAAAAGNPLFVDPLIRAGDARALFHHLLLVGGQHPGTRLPSLVGDWGHILSRGQHPYPPAIPTGSFFPQRIPHPSNAHQTGGASRSILSQSISSIGGIGQSTTGPAMKQRGGAATTRGNPLPSGNVPNIENISINDVGPDVPAALPIVLALVEDKAKLSAYQFLLRSQIEAFSATSQHIDTHARGRNRPIRLGQVGIRCRHCRDLPPNRRTKGSAYFPFSVVGLYQAAQNMGSSHFHASSCDQMTPELKQQFVETLACKSTVGSGKQYWARSARKLGLVDTPDGIRFVRDLLADASSDT